MKKVIIIGATSGIGRQLAKLFITNGYTVGLAGRKIEKVGDLLNDNVFTQKIDITKENAVENLNLIIKKTKGMDIFINCAGVGYQNDKLDPIIELETVDINVKGFTTMMIYVYHYFSYNGGGHIVDISSIAGTRGIGAAASYSASKRYQSIYLQALSQLAYIDKANINITDIKPGFVDTPLLKKSNYPMLMDVEYAGKIIYKAIIKKKRRKIIDWKFALLVQLWKAIPSFIWERFRTTKRT